MIQLSPSLYRVFSEIAEREAGLFLPPAKMALVASRLQRRLRSTGHADFSDYLALLTSQDEDGRAEIANFVAALTTNVTSIYREPHHFALLAQYLRHLSEQRTRERIRIWSAGCSTGEEPLSMAAICKVVLGARWNRTVEIMATDIDSVVLATASRRVADPGVVAALTTLPNGVIPSFDNLGGDPDRLIGSLQEGISYRHHNLMDPPTWSAPFDVIFCRNVTIYFSAPAQEKVHRMLRQNLTAGGLLALGHSERLLDRAPPMEAIGRTAFVQGPTTSAPTAREQTSWH